MENGKGKNLENLVNYRGDNAVIYFGTDGDVGIIEVKIGNDDQKKAKVPNGKIVAVHQSDQSKLSKILNPNNGYSVCQQISIMQNGERSCDYVGQTTSAKKKGRRYRFFVETFDGTTGVVDFKEELTINQAISIMKENGVKNATYADIIAYQMQFGDKDGKFYTREEGNNGESGYTETQVDQVLPNKNAIVFESK